MTVIFKLKQFDTYPNLATTLSDENGPVDLTGASVICRINIQDSTIPVLEKPATILTQTGTDVGKCYIEFAAGDTDVVGTYRVEWRVTFPSGKIATFPRGHANDAKNFNTMIIQDAID